MNIRFLQYLFLQELIFQYYNRSMMYCHSNFSSFTQSFTFPKKTFILWTFTPTLWLYSELPTGLLLSLDVGVPHRLVLFVHRAVSTPHTENLQIEQNYLQQTLRTNGYNKVFQTTIERLINTLSSNHIDVNQNNHISSVLCEHKVKTVFTNLSIAPHSWG